MKKRLLRFLANSRIKRISKTYGKKIEGIQNSGQNVEKDLQEKHKKKWESLSEYSINVKWLNAYVASTNIKSPDYVPESLFYSVIEPILNNRELCLAYADKNIYDLIFPEKIFPTTILRNINDTFLDSNYNIISIKSDLDLEKVLNNYTKVIAKPAIDSGGGENIYLFKKVENVFTDGDGNILNPSFLKNNLKNNFIIQDVLTQHQQLNKFNTTSVNTIRILTWLSPVSNEVVVLHGIFRVGTKGQFLDNARTGGYTIGIKSDGVLNKFATNKFGARFEEVNNISLLEHHQIPFYSEIKNIAKEVSAKYPHFRILGLDMTVDQSGNVQCIEVNNKGNGINFYQLNNGTLFGEYTDEVLKYCVDNRSRLYDSYLL